VAVEALSSTPQTTQLIAEDPFLAAKLRGLKRKQQMLDWAGGALTSEQVSEVLESRAKSSANAGRRINSWG